MFRDGQYAKVLVSALITILISTSSQSQNISMNIYEAGGMGYSMMGKSVLDMDALNTKLKNKGYSSMSEDFFSVGGGGHGIFNNKLILGGEGHTLLGEDVTSGNYKNSLIGGYGFFDIGYIIYSQKQFRCYPIVGIGGGYINLNIREKTPSLSFDNVLDNPERGVVLSTGGFLFSFAIGIDKLLVLAKDDNEEGGVYFGLRTGYTISPFKGDWKIDDVEISDSPEFSLTGPFVRIMLGGGKYEKLDD